jgi:hypothetical protein
MEPKGSLSHSQTPPPVHILSHSNTVHAFPSYFLNIHFNITFPSCAKGSVQVRSLVKCFVSLLKFYGAALLAPRPTPKIEDHPLSAVRDCLFNICAAILHIWTPFLHPQPEDAPCCGDRDPLITDSFDSFDKQFIIVEDRDSQYFNIRRIYSMLPSGKGTT